MYSEGDTDYNNYTNFEKYYIDPGKSFNYEEAATSQINEMISRICDYEM